MESRLEWIDLLISCKGVGTTSLLQRVDFRGLILKRIDLGLLQPRKIEYNTCKFPSLARGLMLMLV